MARSRFPAPYAILQLVFRSIWLALCVATLIAAIYTSAKYEYGREMIGAFIAAIWTIPINVPEVAGLVDNTGRTRRCTDGFLIFLSVLIMFICGILPIMVLLAFEGLNHDCGGRPVEKCREEEKRRIDASSSAFYAWMLPVLVPGLHFFFSILGCVDYARRNKNRPQSQ